jgi:hypothetical protein
MIINNRTLNVNQMTILRLQSTLLKILFKVAKNLLSTEQDNNTPEKNLRFILYTECTHLRVTIILYKMCDNKLEVSHHTVV